MMVVFGLIGGLLVMYMERPIVITSTSFIGAFIFIAALSTFTGGKSCALLSLLASHM